MPAQGLAIAAVDGLELTVYNATPALAAKRDGTWVLVGQAPASQGNWTRSGADVVYTRERTIANSSGSAQSFTDGAVIASQDLGQTISFLNSDENAVTNLIGPIAALPSAPISVQDGQTLRFTELRISF